MADISTSLWAAILGAGVLALLFAAGVVVQARIKRRSLQRCLLSEIVSLRHQARDMAVEIARRHACGEPLDPIFFARWRLSTPLIYPAAGAALAQLPGEALDRVGYFHAQLADARSRLADARLAGRFEPSPYRMLSCLIRAWNHVQPWCAAIDPHFDWLDGDEPDLTSASLLLGAFEEDGLEPVAVAYSWADRAHHFDNPVSSAPAA